MKHRKNGVALVKMQMTIFAFLEGVSDIHNYQCIIEQVYPLVLLITVSC